MRLSFGTVRAGGLCMYSRKLPGFRWPKPGTTPQFFGFQFSYVQMFRPCTAGYTHLDVACTCTLAHAREVPPGCAYQKVRKRKHGQQFLCSLGGHPKSKKTEIMDNSFCALLRIAHPGEEKNLSGRWVRWTNKSSIHQQRNTCQTGEAMVQCLYAIKCGYLACTPT